MLLLAAAIGVALLSSQPASAATRTWTGLGATNNWNDTGNWSGGLVPGAADIAMFDATSNKDATMNVAVNVGGVSIGAGYTGIISQPAGIAATVGATGWTQAGGTFTGGTAAFTVNGPFTLTAGSFSATSGTHSVSGNYTDTGGTFNAGTGRVSFGGGAATLTVSTADAFNNLTLAGGTKTLAAGTTLTVSGTTTLTSGSLNGTGTLAARGDVGQASTYTGGTATLLLDGSAAQTLSGAATLVAGGLPVVVIAKPSGTLSLAGTIRTSRNWTYTAGTLDPGGSTVVFAGGTITGSHTLNALDFRATTSMAAGTTLTAAGAVSLTAGSLNGTGTLAAQADVSQALAYGGGAATLAMTGTGAQTLSGASTTASGNLPRFVIDKPSGTLSLAGTIRTASTWTYTAGTLDPGGSTVVFAGGTITGSHTLNALDFRATTSLAAGTTLTVSGSTTLTSGSLNGTGTLAARGDVGQASTYTGGTATLLLDGSAAQTLSGAATLVAGGLPVVVIAKPSGTLSLAGTIRTSRNWTYTAGTLDPGGSTVVFAGGTITGSHTLNALDFRATTSMAAGTTLTAAGAVSLTAGSLNGTGTLAAQADVSQALAYGGGAATLAMTGTGAQTLSGASTTASGNLPRFVIDKPSGTLSLAGTIRTASTWTYTAGTLDPGGSTVVFAGGTITGSHTLNALDFRATTSLAAGTTLTVSGSTTLTSGSLNGTGTLAARGDVGQASTYTGGTATLLLDGSAAQTLSGAATLVAGGLPVVVIAKPSGTLSLAGTIRTSRNWTYTAGTLDPGGSTVVFAGGTVTSAGMSFYDVSANGGTTTLGSGMTVGHDLTVIAGTFTTSAAGHGLTVGGSLTVGGTLRENGSAIAIGGNVTDNGTIVPGTSTVTLDGASGQSIGGTVAMPAFNLIVNDPLGVTLSTNLTVTSTLTLATGQLDLGAHLLTISNAIAGTPTNLAAGATSSLTVTGAGAGISIPPSISQLGALTLNNTNGLALSADLTVGGTLTLTVGRLDAGANVLAMGPGATVVRTGGWVIGRFEKSVVAGSSIGVPFEIGDATSYTPLDVAFGTVMTPGSLTASTTPGDHPDVADSGLGATRSVNRYWTVTNAGVVFDTYAATFTFAAADEDPGADATAFIVAKQDGTTWTLPTVGTRTVLSTQATGMPSFSDFAVGELASADLGVSVDDGLASVTAGDGLSHGYLITISNAGPSDATAVTLTDTWPSGFSQGTISPSQGSCAALGSGSDFGCDLGTIAAGGSATVGVAYTVAASTPGGVQTETVAVTSAVVDPAATDNSATDTTTVLEDAPLIVTKGDGQTSVTAGTSGHAYTIAITNEGPSDADTVVVDDAVPAALSAGPSSADLAGDCSGSAGNTIHCTLPVSLAPGATWTITVPYSVGSSVAAQTASNTATATSDEDPSGVVALDATDVVTSADLGVSVDDGLASVTAGDGLSHGYLITISNAGPSDATAVTLTDTWPSGFSQGTISPSQGSCAALGSGSDFGCDLGTIAAGGSATVGVAYTVAASTPGGVQTETVAVTSAVVDPAATDNSATDTTTVLELGAAPDTDTLPRTLGDVADAGRDLIALLLAGFAWVIVASLVRTRAERSRR